MKIIEYFASNIVEINGSKNIKKDSTNLINPRKPLKST